MLRRGQLLETSLRVTLLALLGGCAAGGPDGEHDTQEAEPAPPIVQQTPPRKTPPAPTQVTPLFDADLLPLPESRPERCEKVDFLYVVDNSASMTDEQSSLAKSFASFSHVLQDTLDTVDPQIMVIDTDSRNVGDIINANDPRGPSDACEGMLGAGHRMSAEGESCGVMGEGRYMRGAQRHATEAFTCLAHVGTLGNASERPIDALLAATGASGGAADECNMGFLRDDAILVVTLITDEEDEVSDGDPADWKRALLEVKGGDEDAVVVLGLIGDRQVPGGLPGGPCGELDAAAAPRLQQFVESFELGSAGSVCADDYSAFFEQAVSAIDTACEAFEPMVH